jgi:glycosyltransferase involved in cell wall biosynthesis
MEVYGNNLEGNLKGLLDYDQYRPTPLINSSNMLGIAGRAERYIRYPLVLPKGYDLYHVLDHGYAHLSNFRKSSRWVLTCHDLIPYISNRGYAKGLQKVRRPLFSEYSMLAYKNYDRIITISESTKSDLIKYLRIDPEKINVIYYGISDNYKKFNEKDRLQCKSKYGFTDRWNILICGFQHYKNHETCIAVVNELSKKFDKDIALIRIGPYTADWETLKLKISNKILLKEHSNLSENEMLELYNGSDCVLFPSWYEGFGWPPVEAMKCGTPAIVSNVASLPEAVGIGGLTYCPEDTFGMMEAVRQLMLDSSYYQNISNYGITHAKSFNWKKNASETLKVYEDLL